MRIENFLLWPFLPWAVEFPNEGVFRSKRDGGMRGEMNFPRRVTEEFSEF
jgi:hypothetical protein